MPRDPAPWLRATAKHRAIDVLRRRRRTAAVIERAGLEDERRAIPDPSDEVLAHPVTDDLLQLIFLTCHPALTRESQVALTLRLFGGLSSAEIARAFLVPEATVAQRISRAKRTLRDASAELELPAPDQLPARVVGRRRGRVPDLQRGVRRDGRRRLDPARSVRRGHPARPDPDVAAARGVRAARPVGPDAAARLPTAGPDRCGGAAGAARRPGPAALGPAPDPPGSRRARPSDRSRRGPAPVRAAGVDRRLPRTRGDGRRDGLDPDHGALHGAGPRDAVADRRAQPGRRRRPVPRSRCGSGDRRPAHRSR